MQEIYLKRNWWLVFLFAPILAGGAVFCLYATTWPAIKATQMGKPMLGGWSWPTVLIADVVILFLFGGVFFGLLFQLRIAFTTEGVRAPGIFKSKLMLWADVAYVDGISVRSHLLRLTDSKQSIIINKHYYQEPDKLMAFIAQRLPQSCLWRD
jgi:hypothetical protein